VLAAGSFVNCLGNFVVPFLVLYLLHRDYATGVAAGAVSAYAAGKIAAGLAGGLLTDRLGARVTTAGSMAGSVAATLALAIVSGPVLILATAALTGLVTELYRPATSAILAAGVPGQQRVRAFGVYQLGVSAGTAAGTAIGGLVAEHSFLVLFGGDAATSLAWAIGACRVLPRTRTAPLRGRPQPAGPGIRHNRQLARLLAVTVLANLILFQAQSTLPLWAHRQGLSTASYGLLLALNSGLLMALQLPAARLTARWRPQPVIAATSVLIGGGFGLLVFAHTSMLLVLAVTVWSLGELTQWPVAAAYTTSLAPAGMIGRYAGTRSLCYGTALLLAPLAGLALYNLSPALLWAGCAAAGICAAAVISPRPRAGPPREHRRIGPSPAGGRRASIRPTGRRYARSEKMPATSADTAVLESAERTALAFAAIQAVTAIFVAADTRDWAGLRSRLADRVRLDWTSLNGGEPADLTGEQVTEARRTLLSGFDATHHQLGNFLVDEIDAGQARVRFYGTATHVLATPGQDGRWVPATTPPSGRPATAGGPPN
jgi:MFS family permease